MSDMNIKMKEFIKKWSNWWILNPKRKQLDDAFEKELNELIERADKMDLEHMTDKEKEALHINDVSESDLTIRDKWKTIVLIKYFDGDVEFEITEGPERITYIFDKAQIEFLAKWLTHSR